MRIFVILTIVMLALSCTSKKIDKKAEAEKVMQVSREWSKTAATGDVDKVLGYWDDNAVMISADRPLLRGKKAIRQMVEESYKSPGFEISWEPESVEISDNGDMAYIIESSQINFTDPTGREVTQKNKAVSIWRKNSKGDWKNVVDISTPAGN